MSLSLSEGYGDVMDYADIIGGKFGRLTVLDFAGFSESKGEINRRSCYRCQCECGNSVIVKRKVLLAGRCSRCGNCAKLVHEGQHYRYYDSNGDSFVFDESDLDIVNNHTWHIDDYGYPCTRIDNKNHRLTRMLLSPTENEYVDHINGNPRDNRRTNLRIAQCVDNQRNMRIPKHNTSGYKGVTFSKEKNRYKAQISINDKTKHIGYFDNPEDAAQAYDTAARFLYGEFACVNFPQSGEQGCHRNQTT